MIAASAAIARVPLAGIFGEKATIEFSMIILAPVMYTCNQTG